VGTALNYVFLVAAGRLLGSDDYGDLAALIGLLSVVLVPTGALQLAVSREVARQLAVGHPELADGFARAALRAGVLVTAPLLAVALALTLPFRTLLNIDSAAAVAFAMLGLAAALVFPIATGVLLGYQRFGAIAGMYVLPFALRVALLALTAVAGYRLGGAVLAAAASGVASAAVAIALIRDPLRRGSRVARPALGPFLRYLWPVLVGLVGIAVLTNIDLLVVKARFGGDEAGEYAVASAFARVAFFLPATILAVLFPRTVTRHERGEDTADILGRSLLVTAAFGTLLTLFYALAGRGLVHTSFGGEFADGGALLPPFTIAMTLYALANILVAFDLSRDKTRYAWIVAAAIPIQLVVLGVVPDTVNGVVWLDVVLAGLLLLARQAFVESSIPALRSGASRLAAGVRVSREAVVEAVVVGGGATLVACLLLGPVVLHLSSAIVGQPGTDSTGTVADLWQTRNESGFHLLGLTHHTLTGAPFGWDETNALNLQTVLVYYPTYLLSHVIGEVAAYNIATIAGYALSGAAMYWLVRYIGCGRAAAAWAGLVFIVFPWHVARAEHASLLHLEVFPLLFLALLAAARKPTWSRFGLVALANLACWLASGYFGPMAAVTTVAFAVGAAALTARGQRARVFLGSVGAALAAAIVVGAAAVASGTNGGVGLARVADDLRAFGLRPIELVVPPVRSLFFGDSLESFWSLRMHGSNTTEITNYVGLLTLVLAAVGLVAALRRRTEFGERTRVVAVGLAVAFGTGLVFALPSPSTLLGQAVTMPSRLLWELVPAFRVISRWDALLVAALVPLAAIGLQALSSAALRRTGRSAFAVAVPVVAIALSLIELTVTQPKHFRTVPVPAEYSALRQLPPGILAEYPLAYADVYRLWQRVHGRPLLNGTRPDTEEDQARLVLLDPTEPGTAEALALLGITAIGIHPGLQADAELPPREPVADPGFRLVGRYDDGSSLWRVVAPAAPALVTYGGGFSKPSRRGDGFAGFALTSPEGVAVIDIFAKAPSVARLAFDAAPPAGAERTLRIADDAGEQTFQLRGRTRVETLVNVPAGRSRLLVKTDPPATSEDDAVYLSIPRAETALGEAALNATLVSADPGF
jgi:O-antigen/teichoic acid export membrane protein